MPEHQLRKSVRISSEIARGEPLPTLTKTKGFRALLLLAESQGEVMPGDIFEVPQETLRDLLRCRDDAHLQEEIEGLAGIKVNWSRVDPACGGYSIPVSSCYWNKETRTVRFAFDPQFVEAWRNNALGFRRINWEVLVSFRSIYSAKIYEYVCMSHEPGRLVRTRRLTTEQLRELLGISSEAYRGTNAGRLTQEIEKAVKQVCEAQDGFRVSYAKEGRGSTARHWFEVEDGAKQERMRISSPATVVTKGNTRRGRVEAALKALEEARRNEVLSQMASEGYPTIPEDDMNLRIYAARLRNYGIEI